MAQEIKVDLTKTGGLLTPPWEQAPANAVRPADGITPPAQKERPQDQPKPPAEEKKPAQPEHITPEVALDFQRAVLAGKPYEQTVSLYGGVMTVTFSDPSVADERACAAVILDETAKGLYQPGLAGAAQAMQRGIELRKAAAVKTLKVGDRVYDRDAKATLGEVVKALDAAVGSTTLLVALDRAYDDFMTVLNDLRVWAADASFSPAVVSGGFSPVPRSAATRR